MNTCNHPDRKCPWRFALKGNIDPTCNHNPAAPIPHPCDAPQPGPLFLKK